MQDEWHIGGRGAMHASGSRWNEYTLCVPMRIPTGARVCSCTHCCACRRRILWRIRTQRRGGVVVCDRRRCVRVWPSSTERQIGRAASVIHCFVLFTTQHTMSLSSFSVTTHLMCMTFIAQAQEASSLVLSVKAACCWCALSADSREARCSFRSRCEETVCGSSTPASCHDGQAGPREYVLRAALRGRGEANSR